MSCSCLIVERVICYRLAKSNYSLHVYEDEKIGREEFVYIQPDTPRVETMRVGLSLVSSSLAFIAA